MATNRRIEIDVVLNTEQVDQGFQEIEQGSQEVTKGVGNLGESFTGLTSSISGMGDTATQRLGAVGESTLGVVSSVTALGESAQATGMSFSAMLGPISLLAVAVIGVAKAWRDYQDEINGVNIRHDAYIASVSELTSALEELATYQVRLNKAEVENLQNLSMKAKLDIESAQEIRERNALLDKQIFRLDIDIKKAKERIKVSKELIERRGRDNDLLMGINSASAELERSQAEIASKEAKRIKLKTSLNVKEEKAIELGRTGAENFAKFEAEKERLLQRSPKIRGQILAVESKLLEDAELNKLKIREQTESTLTTIAIIESNRRIREIRAQETISAAVRRKAVLAEEQRLQIELTKIAQQQELKREQERAKRMALASARRAKRLAKERQFQAELAQIRDLEIKNEEILGADKITILAKRFKEELKLAGDNKNKRIIAEKKYLNEITKLQIQQNEQEQARQQAKLKSEEDAEKQRIEKYKAFFFETAEFNVNQITDQTTRELALLELRYDKEISLNQHTQAEITEIQRREAIERQKIQKQSIDAQIQQVGEFANQYGAGLAEAAYASLLFGESFKESVGNILISLGQQAAVQSLMETAKGTAALILNPASASNHFLAAGLFAGAAASAGIAGKAMGGGGGGAVATASTGAVSPTGTPQTATTPEREQAETSSMVFNINFGGAVIYDTKKSAEQALADRITNIQNTRRRGAPRRGAM